MYIKKISPHDSSAECWHNYPDMFYVACFLISSEASVVAKCKSQAIMLGEVWCALFCV